MEKDKVLLENQKMSEPGCLLCEHGCCDGHSPTLLVHDEASGIPDDLDKLVPESWAKRTLMIGPEIPCENFFKLGVDKPIFVNDQTNKKV